MKNMYICFLLIIHSFSIASALEYPRSLSTDSRIQTVAYIPNQVISIHGTTFISTQIIFGEDERIMDIQGGDADAWTVSVSKSLPNVLNIKPTMAGSNSDMIIATIDDAGKSRRYFFHLKSNQKTEIDKKSPTYAIQFVYNKKSNMLSAHETIINLEKKTIKDAFIHPKKYHWDYSFHGSHAIMPLHVFDDGKFTYMELRTHQSVPAIFAVDNQAGMESLVNYRRVGEYIVIHQVAPQFTLREGKYHVVSLFNENLIASYKKEL
ncbi:MAG: TrbG/VirB9 family P-type conjugative transfer protein [Gammaproteobacteria bacterium]